MKQADKSKWSPKSIHSIDELKAELDKIEGAHTAGTLSTAGGWSVGQNLEHCAKFIGFTFDGFDGKAPLPIRVIGKLVLKPMMKKPNSQMKPGIKLPKKASSMLPADEVSVEDGLAHMRAQIDRIESGEQMLQDSPLLGKMTHELWMLVHLNHCRMHFGFFDYGDAA
jgi:Protein of unknown function (DUF1569)